ncbi:MAG: ECF transporter S component [Eubacteriales bacterium]|nr:ECF transporter S component [Eubacteriales bacterium]
MHGEVRAGRRRLKEIFVSRGTRHAALVITLALPALLIAYAWFMNHRPPLHVRSEWTFRDTLIQNSDLMLSFVFLLASALPFYLVFDRRRPQARELTPIALMAALCVAGRAAFALIPLPNFKPVSAIVIITALAFGPEGGYLTGALAAILSNFLFGQGPWTPWQMFCWGLVGFLAGILYRAGLFGPVGDRTPDRRGRRRRPVALCVYGLLSGFLYGWIMNLYYVVGWIRPFSWKAFLAAYASSFFFDLSHGVCTALVLWMAGETWVRKLLRVRRKFGLTGEDRRYVMPPSGGEEMRE